MRRVLLLACSLFTTTPMIASAATARRAVMEALATTNNTLYISTGNVRVGIGTAAPTQMLDVRGSIVSNSSITASSFFGTAAELTSNVNAGGQINVRGSAPVATGAGVEIFYTAGTGSFMAYNRPGSAYLPVKIYASSTTILANNSPALSIDINKNVVTSASMTASAYFGYGGFLTGVSTGSVAQSSVTYNLTGSTTETTTFKVCHATATLTTGGSAPIQIHYSGSLTASGASGHYCILNFMQDGAFISPYSSTVGMGAGATSAAGGFGTATTVRVLPAPTAGSHSWCVALIAPFGDTCSFTYSSAHGNEFGVTELR